MNTDKKEWQHFSPVFPRLFICLHLCSALAILFFSGCGGKPNAANIELRKQNQALREEVAALHQARLGDAATIATMQQRAATTAPTLPHERLEQLFIVHGIKLGRLTGGAELERQTPGDEALKVYVTPYDQEQQPLKAAGTFVVELFDLNLQNEQRIGRWEFSLEEARASWHGQALLYTYVLTCPWQTPPTNSELTLKITFTDALTQRTFAAQDVVRVNIP